MDKYMKYGLALWLMTAAGASAETVDTMKVMVLKEVSVVSSPKNDGALRLQPASVTMLGKTEVEAIHPASLKAISASVPNLFMPDYGSRQTSAVYIRGIGSRIGTPAVGMYVDNIPFHDKSAFDFTFCDIERIDVMRGPQSTLYGRNTMGGLIKVHTKSPMRYEGTDVEVGAATRGGDSKVAVSHYHRPTEQFAFSAGAFYNEGKGIFYNENSENGAHKQDWHKAGGGKLRGIYQPSQLWTFDMNASYEYSDEGAYPYFYTGTVGAETEPYPEYIGKITSNWDGRYRRGLLNTGVNAEMKGEKLTLNSVTGFQNINDRMFMDQDFIAKDIYTMTQRQKISTLSEELTLKNSKSGRWNWITGASGFYQWSNISGPVTFRKDGVDWLNSIINTNANANMPMVQSGPMSMRFVFSDNIVGDKLLFDNDFGTPVASAALFHQSTVNDLLGIGGLSATVGLRLDYEKMWLNHNAWYDFSHQYGLGGHLQTPTKEQDITMVPVAEYAVNNAIDGKLSNDYLELLPRLALKYSFNNGNVYGTVSRGYRSGGYNVQNISELMREMMTADMMKDVANATIPVLEQQPMIPTETKEMLTNMLNGMAQEKEIDVQSACCYKPEYAWNYEVGTHLNLLDHQLTIDGSVFLSDVRHLQLSQMSENGLGRVTINAGRSRSIGAEIAMHAQCTERVSLMASYGYTYATLRNYKLYDSTIGDMVNCRGNRVPFMPDHTLHLDAAYTIPTRWVDVELGASYNGTGRIYWNEQNTSSEAFHATLDARATFTFTGKNLQVGLWGTNLTNKQYNVFAFESVNRMYEQHGRPFQCGVNVKIHL